MSLFALSGQATAKKVEDFDSIQLYTLSNRKGMQVKVTNFGAIVTSIVVPDRDGKLGDIALGYDRVEGYINAVDKPYFGAIVGRYGNRIAEGKFTLDGETYSLAVNNPPNHLHGGVVGFDKVVWDAKLTRGPGWEGVELKYLAKDKEEGYPGNLKITVTYKLTKDNVFRLIWMCFEVFLTSMIQFSHGSMKACDAFLGGASGAHLNSG